jgi:hypothetical protein
MRRQSIRTCSINGCDAPYRAQGFCNTHYKQQRRAGTLLTLTRPSIAERFWSQVEKSDGCWLWTGRCDDAGYGRSNGRKVPQLAHRLAWELTYGAIPPRMDVRHLVCDNPPCVNPTHLVLGTHIQNMGDMTAKGRQAKGPRLRHSKLTESDVRSIRELAASGVGHRAIAARFGVTQGAVRPLVLGRTWKHVI